MLKDKVVKDLIKIDGMRGEGGGQILRTSLALSMITGKPFKMTAIRSRRKKPGLLRQHLTAVRAAAEVCGAEVEGDEINSTSLLFRPGPVAAGNFHFKIGSAGSATLVLQTVLPALISASEKSTLVIEGGTHNMMAPPFDFIEKAFLPLINKIGPQIAAKLLSWGFYPAGGGRIEVEINPSAELKSLVLKKRGELRSKRCRAILSSLPSVVGERELSHVGKKLTWSESDLILEKVPNPRGPGNILLFELDFDGLTEVVASFGEKNKAAEKVASIGVTDVRRFLTSDAAVGEYLADQLLIPMALAGGEFTCTCLSSHTLTNIGVIQEFLEVDFQTEKLASDCYRISVK